MFRLECPIQPYAWGDTSSIPELIGLPVTGKPAAELWMGAHPAAPSLVSGRPLGDLIAEDPLKYLGGAVSDEFGELPFLTKILAAAQPLSIQSHPTREQAERGFAARNAAGIAMGANDRVYSDPNHKPELVCALTSFEAKCGFRDLMRTRELFSALGGDGLAPLRERLSAHGPAAEVLNDLLGWLLGQPDSETARLVSEATSQSNARTWGGAWFERDLAWVIETNRFYPNDVGVIAALLLNHVRLEPGQALFLGAGNLHSYLRGVAVEIMANSNNVVRGGLTPKHIDIDELLAVVDCSPIEIPIQAAGSGAFRFDAPVPDFALTRISLGEPQHVTTDGPEILFATAGAPIISSPNVEPFELKKGQVAFRAATEGSYEASGVGVLWRATDGIEL